jgi:hypothetical protein
LNGVPIYTIAHCVRKLSLQFIALGPATDFPGLTAKRGTRKPIVGTYQRERSGGERGRWKSELDLSRVTFNCVLPLPHQQFAPLERLSRIHRPRRVTMSFSSNSIANSARRVRERRRMELELQQQKQQQQVPLLSPRSSSSTTETKRSPRSPRGDPELPASRDGARSISPHSMMMSMSSVHGLFGSPPGSPRGVSSSKSSASSFRRNRIPTVSPSSPQQPPLTTRSWDEGDRPPSPRLPSYTLQPKLHSASPPPKLQPLLSGRQPRTVVELDTFAPVPSTAKGASYLFRRVHSSPNVVGPKKPETDDTFAMTAVVDKVIPADDVLNGRQLATPSTVQHSSSGEDEMGGVCASPALSSASSASVGQSSSSLRRLIHAIETNGPRPLNLTLDEKAVWDLMQSMRRQTNRRDPFPPSPGGGMEFLPAESEWVDMGLVERQAVSQQRDNRRSLQAIQRVLADPVPLVEGGAGEMLLDHELFAVEPEVKVTLEPFGGIDVLNATVDQLEKDKEALVQKLEWKDMVIEQLEKQLESVQIRRDRLDSCDTGVTAVSSVPVDHSAELEELRKDLAEKASALENAKKIIASLENASGSLASDLRRKLREREDEVTQLQKDFAEKQRTLDKLATDLRDLQKATTVPLHDTEASQVRRLQLSSRLETNLAEIRAAAVILESTQDATAVSSLSELLSDSASALKEGIDVIENGLPDETGGPLQLHRELEDVRLSSQRLEQKLRAQTAEAARYKTTMEDLLRRREEEMNALQAEVKILRQQCNTNMEVLARKERELAVLRDSLHVDDDGVGYISDDEPEDDEQQPSIPSPPSKSTHPLPAEYGPSHAEALATLLSHASGNHSFDSGAAPSTPAVATVTVPESSASSNEELESLKSDLIKARVDFEKAQRQLKVEKESLSNAKMIISSLERANKTMMETLRARLQDSNTAIASLLEKSMESEKTSARLRSELDALKRHQYAIEPEEPQLMLAPAPQPLLLTETID